VNILVFVFDLDGTLVGKESILPDKLTQKLRILEENHELVFASGRMKRSIEGLISNVLKRSHPIIAYNGAMVVGSDGKVIYEASLNIEQAIGVIHYLRKEGYHRQAYICDMLFVEEANKYADSYSYHAAVEYILVDDLVKLCRQKGPQKILVIDEKRDLRALASELMKKFRVEAYVSFPTYLEIVKPGINKGTGLIKLAEYEGFEMDEIVAFGDSDNDVEMLKTAGTGIAVGNATEQLKKVATHVVSKPMWRGVIEGIDLVLSGNAGG